MSTLTSYKDGSLGAGPNMQAFRDGSLGRGPNMQSIRDGSLGRLDMQSFRDGSLGGCGSCGSLNMQAYQNGTLGSLQASLGTWTLILLAGGIGLLAWQMKAPKRGRS